MQFGICMIMPVVIRIFLLLHVLALDMGLPFTSPYLCYGVPLLTDFPVFLLPIYTTPFLRFPILAYTQLLTP